MDTSNMQDMMTQVSGAQQSVIQGGMPMNVNQHDSPSRNSLQYTATIYSQDMTAGNQNSQQQQQQMLAMHQNRQQQNEQSTQAMMSDLNPFISGGMGMGGQQQAQQSSDQMMNSSADDDKEGYKAKYSRLYSKPQLP